MDTRIIAGLLLLGRIITLVLILMVLPIQYRLYKKGGKDYLQPLRKTLVVLLTVVAFGQVIPIIIDAFGLFGKGSLGLLIAYATSNVITALLSAFSLYLVYKFSDER